MRLWANEYEIVWNLETKDANITLNLKKYDFSHDEESLELIQEESLPKIRYVLNTAS